MQQNEFSPVQYLTHCIVQKRTELGQLEDQLAELVKKEKLEAQAIKKNAYLHDLKELENLKKAIHILAPSLDLTPYLAGFGLPNKHDLWYRRIPHEYGFEVELKYVVKNTYTGGNALGVNKTFLECILWSNKSLPIKHKHLGCIQTPAEHLKNASTGEINDFICSAIQQAASS